MITSKLKWLWVGLSLLALASCHKEPDIDLSRLQGVWHVVYPPDLSVDGFERYTFDAHNLCTHYIYDALANTEHQHTQTYTLSNTANLITLYDSTGNYTAQYHINKLTSKEMAWENVRSCDITPYINFKRQ